MTFDINEFIEGANASGLNVYVIDSVDKVPKTYTDTQIAQQIIDMGYAKNFICIALGMLTDRNCDLDGHIAGYANDMDAIRRKAIYTLKEKEMEQ